MKIIQKITIVAAFIAVLGLFAVISNLIITGDKYHAIKKLIADDGQLSRVLFSSQDDVQSALIALIDSEKKRIRFAIYTLTDKVLTQALIRAGQRGVIVQGVVDSSYGQSSSSTVYLLANAQIPLWVFQPKVIGRYQGIMHNKFCIFDSTLDAKALVWTGSYNFTASASSRNEENVVILDSPQTVESFSNYFEYLRDKSLQISGSFDPNKRVKKKEAPTVLERLKEIFL